MAQMVQDPSAMEGTQVQSLGGKDPLQKGMASHSRISAWEIHGQSSLAGTVHGVTESQTRLTNTFTFHMEEMWETQRNQYECGKTLGNWFLSVILNNQFSTTVSI